MIAEGKYKVKSIVGGFTGESPEKKTPYVGVEFELVNGENCPAWVGYMSETPFIKNDKETNMAKENTRTLVMLGFKGRSFADLSDTNKSISDLFNDLPQDTYVVIEHEEREKEDGTPYKIAKISWINFGSGPMKFEHKEAIVKFKSLGLDGELLKLQKELGTKKGKAQESKQEETSGEEDPNFSADDIPF